MPTFGSLFAGIGGIDLGLERAGWTGRWQVEYEPFCQRVLAKHWPDVTRYGDIHDVEWSGVEPVDLVAGGFPCQPVSLAGNRKIQDDDRWLWPEFARCVRELRPRYVLVENVPGLLVGGGMDDVLGGLAELGYDVEWESIPAAAVGAPHLRYRVWIVAYAHDLGGFRIGGLSGNGHPSLGDDPDRRGSPLADATGYRLGAAWPRDRHDRDVGLGSEPTMADADRGRREQRHAGQRRLPESDALRPMGHAERLGPSGPREYVEPVYPATSRHRQADQPLDAGWWATEPDVGRVAHGVPARVDRLRALGNAVVPQVVEWIGRRIIEAEGEVAA